jgi:hypothetical protein
MASRIPAQIAAETPIFEILPITISATKLQSLPVDFRLKAEATFSWRAL